MAAVVVPLRPIRNALEQAERLGSREPRQSIVARVLGDIHDGHHPYRVARDLQSIRLALPRPLPGGAA